MSGEQRRLGADLADQVGPEAAMPRAARPAVALGFMTMQSAPWRELVASWRLLDSLGVDSLWVCDHLVNRWNPLSDWFDGWTALAALATLTSRARIGMLVTPPGLHRPAVLARQVLTVDHASGGRLEIGFGAGGAPLDQAIAGIEAWTRGERQARLAELVELLDRLLREDVEAYVGGYERMSAATLRPRPLQAPRPPFTIAGHHASSLMLAARFGSRWNSYARELKDSLSDSLRQTRRRLASLRAACETIGRDPSGLTASLLLPYGRLAVDPFSSRAAFDDFVNRYREIGVDELIFFYPLDVHTGARGSCLPLLEEILSSRAIDR